MGPEMRESIFITSQLTWIISGIILAVLAIIQCANTPIALLGIVHLASLAVASSSHWWRHGQKSPFRSSG